MATSTHTEVPSGGRKDFPPFNKDTFASQLVWLAITFVALYLLMSKVALPRVGGILEGRRAKVAADLVEAQRLKQQSEDAIAAYEKSLAEARGRAQAIAAKTRDKLMAKADARRKALEAKLGERLAEAEKSIDTTRKAAMANVKGIATETAAAIVERLIGTKPPEKAVEDAIVETLKR
jgi:F-type H+-transporting ATPase subunit b